MPAGRPSDFKQEFVEQSQKLCNIGATDADIADFFEVDVRTIYRWKQAHPDFSQALKRGKEIADDLVEQRLFQRATGYSHDAVKIMQSDGKPLIVPYIEHCPPDTVAAIFWLKNRRPDQWRDKVTQEVTGADGAPLVPVINLTIGAGPATMAEAEHSIHNKGD